MSIKLLVSYLYMIQFIFYLFYAKFNAMGDESLPAGRLSQLISHLRQNSMRYTDGQRHGIVGNLSTRKEDDSDLTSQAGAEAERKIGRPHRYNNAFERC